MACETCTSTYLAEGRATDSKLSTLTSTLTSILHLGYNLHHPPLLDPLTAQARTSPRLRQHYDLRNTPGDNSQRILNALEPGTELPIHRHRESSETVVMLRGKGRWNYYDDNGNLTDSFLVSADGDIRGISVPKGQWHNTECLESGTVINNIRTLSKRY